MARFDADDILEKIHRIVELNVDYPTSGDDDYDLRFGLVNDYIDTWGLEEGVFWDELWALASFSCTGATSYSLVSSVSALRTPGGYVEFVSSGGASTYFDVIKPEEVRLRTTSVEPFAYFLGDPQTGFTLYFNPNYYPTDATGTIKFPYYKKPTLLTVGSSKPEMSNPAFLVHSVASDILSQDDPGESDKHLQIAQNYLKAMKTLNAQKAPFMRNRVEDRAGHLFGGGFGK